MSDVDCSREIWYQMYDKRRREHKTSVDTSCVDELNATQLLKRNTVDLQEQIMSNTRRLICQPASPDYRRRDPLLFYASEAVSLASIVIDLHALSLYIVQATSSCQWGMNSSILCYSRHLSQPCIPGLVRSLTEWHNTPRTPGWNKVTLVDFKRAKQGLVVTHTLRRVWQTAT
jgi:hypothetical protein